MTATPRARGPAAGDAGQLIEARIAALGGWRGETLRRVRGLIREADPAIVETVKWVKPSNPFGVPVWEHDGIVCTGEAYKDTVKLTFAAGAALADPGQLFNASLEGNVRRAIDIHEGDTLDARAFKALIGAAVAHNVTSRAAKTAKTPKTAAKTAKTTTAKTTTTKARGRPGR